MIIDDDNNYYEVTNEDFMKISTTGKPTASAPVFMQKVETEHKNKKFIQVGVIATRDTKTGIFDKGKPIFMIRTKELEEGERRMIRNFAEVIALEIFHRIARVSSDWTKKNGELIILLLSQAAA